MDGRYLLGVAFAVVSGAVFNAGALIQKLGVMRCGGGAKLMRRLIKNPLWVAGFTLQMVIGSPLNMFALAMIGPAIIPGLSSIGMVVLAVGAVRFAGEKFRPGEIVGIVLVMLAVTVFGFSGMSVDMRAVGIYTAPFLIRLGVYAAVLTLLSLACHAAQKRYVNARGVLRTINAGLLFAQSNLWLGVITQLLSDWITARFALSYFPYILVTSAVVAATSMLGIAETQRAFAVGEASKLIPIQNVPAQILPILAYFTVFALRTPDARALPLTLAGVVLALAGGYLLAGRQMAQPSAQAATETAAQ
jgi:hypothetical protein